MSPEFKDASLNHVFMGDVSAWMYNCLAGINYDSAKPGFEHILIRPYFVKDLQWVKGEYKSVKGLIRSEWKREGFTPADRLAWWEAGFGFEDALQLARSGMSPAEAAWHGHEKLKELRAKNAAKAGAQAQAAPAPTPEAVWQVIAPHVKAAGLAALAFCAVLAAYLLRRRSQMHRKRSADRHKGPGAHHPARQEPGVAAPISEAPASAAPESVPPSQDTAANTTSVPDQAAQKRSGRPARRYALIRSAHPHCVHCKSTNVRTSRIQPHKFAGINFTEYFRCKHCGKHFAIVSYTPILLVAGSIILTLTALTVGLLYAVSGK